MNTPVRLTLAALAIACATLPTAAQTPTAAPSAPVAGPPGVAAVVNSEPIRDVAVERVLRDRPDPKGERRIAALNQLIDRVLMEQYLVQQGVKVDPKEVDRTIDQLKKESRDWALALKKMNLTEAELRKHIEAYLREEAFFKPKATDAELQKLFQAEPEMFDGTLVRARHIQLTPANDAQAREKARAELAEVRKQIEGRVVEEMQKLPANLDNLARERERWRLLDVAFAEAAVKRSACGSSKQGGDLGWLSRLPGEDVFEAFKKLVFAQKPWEMSGVVETPFGLHLILVTDRKPGTAPKFEDIREAVRDVYCSRLRAQLLPQLREKARVTVYTAPAAPVAAGTGQGTR
jgi:peptidyl-prolyl cis-trans isomerase C